MTPVLNVADVVTPETFRLVADALPNIGVTNVGLVANTLAPVPVSSVSAAARLELDGVARKVATLAARPEIPVETGSPVQFVRVPDCGVPNIGVTNVGLVANTLAPVPVSSVSAVKSCSDVKDPNDVAVLTDVIAPVRLGILVVEVAVPVKLAVIVPALKLPEPSLATIADAVFAFVAVVALLETLSAVAIVASLVSTIPADALISALTITPAAIDVTVLTDVISPVRLGILVVEVAVPLTAPLNDVAVMTPAVTFASVVIPVTFKSVKVLGAFAIAVSIVAVVVASSEAMFFNCLAALMTSVVLILSADTDVIPAFTIFLLSSMIVEFEILIATVFVYTRGIVI
jgi:hypothetical protein